MTLQNYTTEELKAELKRRSDLAEAEEAKKKEDVLKFAEFIEKQAKAYGFNLPNRGYDVFGFAKDLLEQREQKSTDKIEPKFHVGEWVASKGLNTVRIINVEGNNNKYEVEFFDGDKVFLHIDYVDRFFHLWTIEDAKDGDMLSFYCEYRSNKMMQVGIIEKYVGKHGGCSNTFKIYVGVNWDDNLQIDKYMGCSDIHPATKEQRDFLFTKMKEAGYEWDANKKELIKIEDKP